jgi:hypothetical protein
MIDADIERQAVLCQHLNAMNERRTHAVRRVRLALQDAPHPLDQRTDLNQCIEEGTRTGAIIERRPCHDTLKARLVRRYLHDMPRLPQRICRGDIHLDIHHCRDVQPCRVFTKHVQIVHPIEQVIAI